MENAIATRPANLPGLTAKQAERVRRNLEATHSPGTLETYLSAFRQFCEWMRGPGGRTSPLVAPPEKIAAYLSERAETRSVASVKHSAAAIALCCVMRDCLLRRSEAAALRWKHIEFESDGTGRLRIERSKTDQAGTGAVGFLSRETVRALKAIPPPRSRKQVLSIRPASTRSPPRRTIPKQAFSGYPPAAYRTGFAPQRRPQGCRVRFLDTPPA